MLQVPVYDMAGRLVRTVEMDEAVLGGRIRGPLLHAAVVMYEANRRVGTRKAKTRGEVAGTGRKMYRQKGTGYARAGSRRSPIRRGGGVARTIAPRDWRRKMPVRARRVALASALLGKFRDGEVLVVEGLAFEEPRTRRMAALLEALEVRGSFLLAPAEPDRTLYLSARNIPGALVRPVAELNAYEVLRQRRLILTPEAFEALQAWGRRLFGLPAPAGPGVESASSAEEVAQ